MLHQLYKVAPLQKAGRTDSDRGFAVKIHSPSYVRHLMPKNALLKIGKKRRRTPTEDENPILGSGFFSKPSF